MSKIKTMKKFVTLTLVIMFIMMLALVQSASAAPYPVTTDGTLNYAIIDTDNATVLGPVDPLMTGPLIITDTITIEEITYPVTAIGDYAFVECTGLTSLTIGNNVQSIGESAFNECIGLTGTLNIPDSVTTIGGWAFDYCTGLEFLTIGNNVQSIGTCTFENCTGLTGTLNIPDSVTTIGEWSFYNCKELTGVIIGENVQSIGTCAFQKCTGLIGMLIIPDSVTLIGGYAFDECTGLTSLTIGYNVESIITGAFENCTGLTGVLTIPDKVTTIGDLAFESCTGFTSLTIGNSVTTIGDWAFYNCNQLQNITALPINAPTTNSSAFGEVPYTAVIYTPNTQSDNETYKTSPWSSFSREVSFDSNGGTTVPSQTVVYISKVSEPAAPTKDEYTFAGWYSDSGLTQRFDFTTPITASITLYAKWEDITLSSQIALTAIGPVDYSDVTKFTAKLTAGGQITNVSNVTVSFIVDNEVIGSALTNRKGIAVFNYKTLNEPGVHVVQASVPDLRIISGPLNLQIDKENVIVKYTGIKAVKVKGVVSNASLLVQVLDEDRSSADLSGIAVGIEIKDSEGNTVFSNTDARTDDSGKISLDISFLAKGRYTITLSSGENNYYNSGISVITSFSI